MRFLIGFMIIVFSEVLTADWSPSEIPDPKAIFDEAIQDASTGNYKDALAKHLWFHNNALKYQRSLYGVRLSFALSEWKLLAELYPEALKELKKTRNLAGQKVKNNINPYEFFHDYKSLNRVLNEENKTVKLFIWLDNNRSEIASDLYRLAQPALIKEKRFDLAGKYVDSESSLDRIVSDYYRYMDAIQSGFETKFYKKRKKRAEKFFSNSAATLVAILVLNGRPEEAKSVSEKVIVEMDTLEFRSILKKALDGIVPDPLY